ncbi:hypothetical protein Ahy_B02g060393 isoform A [Arachis hypogaea]|uniref:Aminotransferase-like plant mobile domain-containing protein n=1 Tax=Arachis hypogaea TaxID=3818 RepID=A0A445AIE8_ARAHY|nr:hypothetical protein Ahy_B02g060393 isoform A [Arachis hypogaea]
MSKFFLPLAALLHEGNTLNLAKLLLGHVFEELGQFVHCLQNNCLISTGGPLWLFQLWLNAIFEKFMIKSGGGATNNQHIEGFRLADYKSNFPDTQSDEDRFWALIHHQVLSRMLTPQPLLDNHNTKAEGLPPGLLESLPLLLTQSHPLWDLINHFCNNTWIWDTPRLMIQFKLQNLSNHYRSLFFVPLKHRPPSLNIQAALSAENLVASDSDSVSRVAETTNSDSPRSRVFETPQGFSSPPQQAEFQTPPGQESIDLGTSTTPTSATLANLISVLNRVIQEDEVPILAPTLPKPSSSIPLFQLDVDTREQLRSLLKLLDHPPIAWIKDALLNQLLSDLLNSPSEFPASIPYSAIIQ